MSCLQASLLLVTVQYRGDDAYGHIWHPTENVGKVIGFQENLN